MNAPLILPTSGIQPEIAVAAIPDDERVWVPQAKDVWFRPLLLNTVTGGWCNLLRVRKSGVLSRHRHPMLVVGYVIKGRWKYLEHDWTAEEGSFVYEPPGEVHTLTVPEDCPEMITFFNISGAMIYLDADGRQNGYEDVWSKIDMCRAHYAQCGLGASFVEQFIRWDSDDRTIRCGRFRRRLWRMAALGALGVAQCALAEVSAGHAGIQSDRWLSGRACRRVFSGAA